MLLHRHPPSKTNTHVHSRAEVSTSSVPQGAVVHPTVKADQVGGGSSTGAVPGLGRTHNITVAPIRTQPKGGGGHVELKEPSRIRLDLPGLLRQFFLQNERRL